MESLIHEKLQLFLDRLQAFAANQETLDLDRAFSCLTADVTMRSCYPMDLGLLEAPTFRPSLIVDIEEMDKIIPALWYFPILGAIMNRLVFKIMPDSIVKRLLPGAASIKDMMKVRCNQEADKR